MRKFIILNFFYVLFFYSDITNLDGYYFGKENTGKPLVNLCYFITNESIDIPKEINIQKYIIENFINSEVLNSFKLHILLHGHLGYYSFTKPYINTKSNKKESIFNTHPRGVFLIDEEISARIFNVRNENIVGYKYIEPFLNGNVGILSYDIMDPIVPRNKLSLQQFLDQKILFPIFKDGIVEFIEKKQNSYIFDIIVKSNFSYFQYIGISQDTGIPTNRVRFVCRTQGKKLVPVTLYPI